MKAVSAFCRDKVKAVPYLDSYYRRQLPLLPERISFGRVCPSKIIGSIDSTVT